jgi:hypothetical protein
MIISKKSIDLIVLEEVSSKQRYEKEYQGIVLPPGNSGATIGIGYDLAHHTANDIERDWRGLISSYQIEILKMFVGLSGNKARVAVANNASAKQVKVPFDAAMSVFIKTSLPKYVRQVLKIYPNADKLMPDAAGALLSLVYNRGADLTGDRRKEMKAIQPLVIAQDYKGIAAQFRSMKRLWNNGLVGRREREAVLVETSNREYKKEDIVDA